MSLNGNNIRDLFDCFRRVCAEMEKKADFDLMLLDKEWKKDCAENEKSLQKFNEKMSAIAEICSEVSSSSEALNLVLRQNLNDNTLILPYEMHSDLVKCINGLYRNKNMSGIGATEKLINESNAQLINDLIKLGHKSTSEVKDIESTLKELRENFKITHFGCDKLGVM